MDAATKIAQDIVNGGKTALEAMILEQRAEDQLLDFKMAAKHSAPLEDTDRKNLSKSVGAFANADGGVIAWGVRCDKNAEGLDVAWELKPIKSVYQFKLELENTAPQLLEPYPEMTHTIVPDKDDTGYVITCVPHWDGYPVRSRLKNGGSDFYLRTGNQIHAMGYNALADRFGRRPLPKLRVAGMMRQIEQQYELRMSVINHGRGLAKIVAVTIPNIPNWPQQITGWSHASGVTFSNDPFKHPGTCYDANVLMAIHGGRSHDFFWSTRCSNEFISAVKNGLEVPYSVVCDGFIHDGIMKASPDPGGIIRWLLQDPT